MSNIQRGEEFSTSREGGMKPDSPKFVISSDSGYWSNEFGWVESISHGADIYDSIDFYLPVGENVRVEQIKE